MTPSAVASARAAFTVLAERPALRERLWRNVGQLHHRVRALGLRVGAEPSPVIALELPDPPTAVGFWNRLIDEGIYTNIAVPPATPNGRSLLRVSVSAAHDEKQLDRAIAVIASVGAELGLVAADRVPASPRRTRLRVVSGDDRPGAATPAPAALPTKASAAPGG